MRTIKEMLTAGEIINTFAVGRFTDPTVVEMFAIAGGHQAFWIDQEHVNSSSEAVYACAAAGRSHGLDPVRGLDPLGAGYRASAAAPHLRAHVRRRRRRQDGDAADSEPRDGGRQLAAAHALLVSPVGGAGLCSRR